MTQRESSETRFSIFLVKACTTTLSVSVFVSLQTAVVQHDRHSDEQRLGSLGVQRQAKERAPQVREVSSTVFICL